MTTHNLVRRGDQWWLQLTVPAPLRRFFLSSNGKPMRQIREPMGDSKTVAAMKANQRAAACSRVFVRLHAGEDMTPEQVRAELRNEFADDPLTLGNQWEAEAARMYREQYRILERAARFEAWGAATPPIPGAIEKMIDVTPPPAGPTITKAAEAWYLELARDSRPQTVDGHRTRVNAFAKKYNDPLLADVTRAMASEFLDGLKCSARTRNNYALSLKMLFLNARKHRLWNGQDYENPFHDQRKKAGNASKQKFTVAELQALFDALPRNVAPTRHSPETALPWVALVALYTGARLEEICQLTTADIREEGANGATVWVIDIHNGGENNLKNESAQRLIPIHTKLARLGFLDYVKQLPTGPLFPGLTRRKAKGNKLGARVGELFRKKLIALGMKRKGLDFHSLRHTVIKVLDNVRPEIPERDIQRVVGHMVEGVTFGVYGEGELKNLAAAVEHIVYDGLNLDNVR
jgi:integrase